MTFARPDHISALDTLPRMPAWVTSARDETLEDVFIRLVGHSIEEAERLSDEDVSEEE